MDIHRWVARSLWLGVFSILLPGAPSLATGRPAIVQLRPAENGLLTQSTSQRLVDQANQKEEKGDRPGALRDLEQALQADPRNFWAYMARAGIRLQMQEYQGVIADTTSAIELNPRNPDNWSPYNLRAMAHYLLKQYTEAAQDYELAMQFKLPRELLHLTLFSRGDALRLAGDLDGSIADCTKSIQLFPTPEAHDNRGMAHAQKGDIDLALADYRTAARGFRARGDTTNLDAVVDRVLGLQAGIANIRLLAPRSWQFPGVIESARKLSPRNLDGRAFDQSGLAYPLGQIEALPVASMPPSELQKYADIVTHAFPDASFLRSLSSVTCRDIPPDQLNTTAIANVAYISLQAKFPSNREEAARCLKELQGVWRRQGNR